MSTETPAIVPPNVERMIPYKPGKPLEELERELGIRNAIKLASNENPYGPSPKVIEAVREAAAGLHFYPDGAAFALRRDLAAQHEVEMDQICLGSGSNELIDLLCRTFPSREDHVIFGKPSFVCYWLGCIGAGVAFTEVGLRDHLAWDVDAILAAVQPNTKLLFVANPNNPTGVHLPRPELERLLRELPEHVVCVLDEAYVDFADADDYASALQLADLRERLIVLRTFSKVYGLAGLRVGYAVGPATLIQYLHRMRNPFNVNAMGQLAARVALADQAHVAHCVERNAAERARLSASLRERGFEVAPSQANFVLFDAKRPSAEVFDGLLRRGVIVRPMPPPIEQWVRLTVGTPAQNDRMLDGLDVVLKSQ